MHWHPRNRSGALNRSRRCVWILLHARLPSRITLQTPRCQNRHWTAPPN